MTAERLTSPELTVFLVRHGRTRLNVDGRIRGQLDVELDSVGQLETARLANVFGRVPLSRIVSSPLVRARATAAPIALIHDLAVEVNEGFIDRDYGRWNGDFRHDVETRFGSLDSAPGVEPSTALDWRLLRTFNQIADRSASAGPIMCVGHDATNSALLRLLVPALSAAEAIEQHTGCWNRLDLIGGRWAAVVINETPTDASHFIEL